MSNFGKVFRRARAAALQNRVLEKYGDRLLEAKRGLDDVAADLQQLGFTPPADMDGWGALARAIGIDPGPLTLAEIAEAIAARLEFEVVRAKLVAPLTPVAAADPPVCRLRIEGEKVFLDGQAVALDMGPESRGAALCMLRHLLAATGQWVSGTELNERELKGSCRVHDGARWDRARKALPPALRDLIDSNRRKGYRLTL